MDVDKLGRLISEYRQARADADRLLLLSEVAEATREKAVGEYGAASRARSAAKKAIDDFIEGEGR